MNTDGVIKIKKEHDKKEFIREVAIYLAKEQATPTDILERSFSDVKEKDKEYLFVTGQASVNYTCSVGYDRQEVYYEQVKKYKDGRAYYENVKKTRTVTDWQPHSGSNTSKESTIVGNAANQDDYRSESDVLLCYKTSKDTSKEEVADTMAVNSTALNLAEHACVSSCFYSVHLPGDRQKDKDYSGDLDVSEVTGLIVPEFEMSYDYQGTKHKTKGFAAGNMQVRAEYPNISTDVSKEAKDAVKHFKFLAIGALILGIILNIFMSSIGMWCLVGYAAAITFLVLYIKKGNAKMKSIYAFRQEEKKKDLIAFLQKNGMKPLTTEEISSFSKN